MAIKNINEIQSSNYSKHSEQFYIDALSSLANSGQRYGTPGTGFTGTSLGIKDVYPAIQSLDNSYIQFEIHAYKDDLERYLNVIGENYDVEPDIENYYQSYINAYQVSKSSSDGISQWSQTALEEFSYLTSWYLSGEDATYTFVLDPDSNIDNEYTLYSVHTTNSIEAFGVDNDKITVESLDSFKIDGKQYYIKTEYIKLSNGLREKLTNLNNINSNYIFNKKYVIETDEDGNTVSYNYYELASTDVVDDTVTFNYKKYVINDTSSENLQSLYELMLYSTIIQTFDHIKFFDAFWKVILTEFSPVVSSFEMVWDEKKSAFTYTDTEDDLIVNNNTIIKNTLSEFLKNTVNSTALNKLFIKKILINEFYNYYSKLPESSFSVLDENPWLSFKVCMGLDSKFNLLVRTGEDGNVQDDLHYYTTTDGIAINQCLTDDFSECINSFLLNDNKTDNIDRCRIISDGSALYNKDAGKKYITNLYNYKFNYIDADDNTTLLTADVVNSILYTMPYLNDNGYWIINNQLTGVLGTCKHSDSPSIVIIHNYKNQTGETVSSEANIINVVDLPIEENQEIDWESISGEILSTYRINDLKKVNFKTYKTTSNNLLRISNISAKYSVPCFLPDVQQTLDDVNLNYITDFLKSALFVCITDIDCIPEAEEFKSNLSNSTVTTFWVYDEDKENSVYFKPLVNKTNNTAVDLFSLSNVGDVIKYSTENITTNPDKELFTQLVFDDVAVQLKQVSSSVSHYPFISNVASYTFVPTEDKTEAQKNTDTTSKIGVIPINKDYTNNANLLISFSDYVEFNNGKIIEENSIHSGANKGIQLQYQQDTNTYKSLATKYDSNYDVVLNSESTSFIDTLDLSGVLINHNNIYNRTNFLIPSQPESNLSYIYASYIGTDPDTEDRSYLVIGTTTKRYNLNPSLLSSTYSEPFRTQSGLKIQMPNVIIDNADTINLTANNINLTGKVLINGNEPGTGGGSGGSGSTTTTVVGGPWNYYGSGTTYSAVMFPVFKAAEWKTYITSSSTTQSSTFASATISTYTLNIKKYLEKMYTVTSSTSITLTVNIKYIASNKYIVTSPIAIVADYNPINKIITSIQGVAALDFI